MCQDGVKREERGAEESSTLCLKPGGSSESPGKLEKPRGHDPPAGTRFTTPQTIALWGQAGYLCFPRQKHHWMHQRTRGDLGVWSLLKFSALVYSPVPWELFKVQVPGQHLRPLVQNSPITVSEIHNFLKFPTLWCIVSEHEICYKLSGGHLAITAWWKFKVVLINPAIPLLIIYPDDIL